MTKRKFYLTTITIKVLHEEDEDISGLELDEINRFVMEGPGLLAYRDDKRRTLNGGQAAKALVKAGSEGEFFRLTPEGEDSET